MSEPGQDEAEFRVPTGLHLQSRLFASTASLWRRLGNLETRALADALEDVHVQAPIYVTSLARAGTTIVTEMLERHQDVTSHRYSDFPNVWTPYWRNDLLQKTRRETPRLQERAHQDRIQVSNDSPEAVEEVLWMHFFPDWHGRASDQVLDGSSPNLAFDAFYRDHIRKLLAVRGCSRYLAKGNYNIARLGYLLELFPDARFLVPLRDPAQHIASLAKQHRLFMAASRHDPRTPRQLAWSGHFEFGPRRNFVHFGDESAARSIRECWAGGREVEGWARYWAATYRHLFERLQAESELRTAVLLFRYEDLCRRSEPVIDAIFEHARLDTDRFGGLRAEYASRLSLPDYYDAGFSAAEAGLIRDHCSEVLQDLQAFCLEPV